MAAPDQISATTREWFRKGIADNIFPGQPVTELLDKKGDNVTGGRTLNFPVLANITAGGNYAGFDQLDAPDNNEATEAVFNWSQYYAACAISGIDWAKNQGDGKVVDLYGTKMEAAGLSLTEQISQALFAISPTGSVLTSLDDICWSSGTVGGLAATDITFGGANKWAGQVTTGSGGALTLLMMETAYLSVCEGNTHPDLIVMDKGTGYPSFWKLVQLNQRYQGSDSNVGFQNLKFNDCLVAWDSHIALTGGNGTGLRAYLLNTQYLFLKSHQDAHFKSVQKEPTYQDAYLEFVLWYGQLCCNNRRFQGTLHNFITA